jgi:hypothetical protein
MVSLMLFVGELRHDPPTDIEFATFIIIDGNKFITGDVIEEAIVDIVIFDSNLLLILLLLLLLLLLMIGISILLDEFPYI